MSLTTKQIERQNLVDGIIYSMISALSPRAIDLPWNIEEIAEIREVIQEIMEEKGITEMEFYPYEEVKA